MPDVTPEKKRHPGIENLQHKGRPKGSKNKPKKLPVPEPEAHLSVEQFLSEISGIDFIENAMALFAPPITMEEFFNATTPFTAEPWQQHLCDRLTKLAGQKGQRLAIHKPPQFGGSMVVSQRYPAYLIGRNPLIRVRQFTHNQSHSETFSQVTQDVMRSPEYLKMFPQSTLPTQTNVQEWSTPQREKQRDGQPSYMALGIQGGGVGVGADILIIDDPYANFEEAQSPVINRKIRDWHKNILVPRLNPDTNVILMFHRFHPDDYAGWLINNSDRWEVLRYAALSDEDNDPMNRPHDVSLSARYPFEYLDEIRKSDPLVFQGLYQGKPELPEGNAIKRDWFPVVTDVDAGRIRGFDPKQIKSAAVYFDIGASSAPTADRTVGTLGCRLQDDTEIWLWQMAGQWDPADRDNEIERFSSICNRIFPGIPVHLEAGFGIGKDSVDRIQGRLTMAGINAKFDKVRQKKWERATSQHDSFISAAQTGRIKLYAGNYYSNFGFTDGRRWITAYLDEVCRLQAKNTDTGIVLVGGKDDRFDSGVGVHNKLIRQRKVLTSEERMALQARFG